MDTDSEEDLFGDLEEEEFDEDEEWDIMWDAGMNDPGDVYGDSDVSSISESVDMSAEMLKKDLREKAATGHDDHNDVVISVCGDLGEPHKEHGNADYRPLDLPSCGVSLLSSSKTHNQTCDSCCYGPATPDGAFVSVIDESGNEAGHIRMVNVEGVEGCGRDPLSIPSADQVLALPDLRILGRPVRIYGCYSCRWSDDSSYLGISTAVSRVSFWLNNKGSSSSLERVLKEQQSEAIQGGSLQPCGSILIPEFDLNTPELVTVRNVLSRCRLMLNCIRFGTIAGIPRAVVAGQNGGIYVFELPPRSDAGNKPPAGVDFICHSLRPPNAPGRFGSHTQLITDLLCQMRDAADEPLKMPVVLEDTLVERMPELREMDHAAEVLQSPIVRECLSETQVLGKFSGAVNCAQPSPCGRWVAVLTDSMTVMLLPEALDYRLRGGMLLRWPDVGLPSRTSSCTGCQYAAWSADGQYLAVSSDSHKAVTIWRLQLKQETALDPEALGRVLKAALLAAAESGSSSADTADLASELRAYLPAVHTDFLAKLPSNRHKKRGGARASRGRQSGRGSDVASDARTAASGHVQVAPDVRDRILGILGRALWQEIHLERVCSYKDHEDACLSLTFVPGSPTMLCWAEERGRVHICDVRRPQARQCVHLSTLPMQVAFARGALPVAPPSAADNWGVLMGEADASAADVDGNGSSVSLQLQPAAEAESASSDSAALSEKTQAEIILQKANDVLRSTGYDPVPAAMLLALIRGQRVQVPQRLEEVGHQMQKELGLVLKNNPPSTSTELSLMDQLLAEVAQGPTPHHNIVTGVAAAGQSTIVVTTTAHVFKLRVDDEWEVGMAWPGRFRKAVQELLKVHHRQAHSLRVEGKATSLGDMPPDVMRLIILKTAGERVDWISDDDVDCETGADVPEFCGLTRRQCFSASFLSRLNVPVIRMAGLLGP